jgi:F-type H+-transporting ATPase subunit b
MEATLHALGGILLKAVPTLLLVVFLHFYLKSVFFKPLERALRQRYEETEGARRRAAETLERAAAKTAEYEAALRAARSEIYQAQEKLFKELEELHAAELLATHRSSEAAVQEAKSQIAGEVESAKTVLAREIQWLSNRIVESVLSRSAA